MIGPRQTPPMLCPKNATGRSVGALGAIMVKISSANSGVLVSWVRPRSPRAGYCTATRWMSAENVLVNGT